MKRELVWNRWLLAFLCAAVALCLSGCGSTPVADGVTQSQANHIVSELSSHGIIAEASKESGSRGLYSVRVGRGSYVQAVSILHEKGLPGEPEQSFADAVASKGFLPGSREMEALRIDRALAIELEELLRAHSRIAGAKVIVRLNFLRDSGEPGVSVVLQARSDEPLDPAEILGVVSRVVPGIKPEHVSIVVAPPLADVTLSRGEAVQNLGGKVIHVPLTPFLGMWRIPEDDFIGFSLTLFGVLVVMGLVGVLVGYWLGYFLQPRRMYEANLPEVTSRPLKLDKPGRRASIEE